MNRSSMPSHYNVFNYWRNKCITSNGEVKIEYGYPGSTLTKDDLSDSVEVVVDWGEPMCWCCGNRVVNNYDELDSKIYQSDENLKDKDDDFLKKLWNHKDVTSVLQRAHIIPNALKGSSNPENIFLICSTCHLESPDSSDPKFFLRYIYDERKNGFNRRCNELSDYLKRIGLYLYYTDNSIKPLKLIGTHSGTVVKSSRLAFAVMKFIEGYKTLCNMTVDDVKGKTEYLKWVTDNNDKRAEPYINIENKLIQLATNPTDNDIHISDFYNIISHSDNYEIAEMISDKYKCNKF